MRGRAPWCRRQGARPRCIRALQGSGGARRRAGFGAWRALVVGGRRETGEHDEPLPLENGCRGRRASMTARGGHRLKDSSPPSILRRPRTPTALGARAAPPSPRAPPSCGSASGHRPPSRVARPAPPSSPAPPVHGPSLRRIAPDRRRSMPSIQPRASRARKTPRRPPHDRDAPRRPPRSPRHQPLSFRDIYS